MIDRESRDGIACALRRFASGRLVQADLDKAVWRAEGSSDAAVVALLDEIYWAFLNFGPNRLVGRHSLSSDARRNVARWVLFLRSNEEYRWPRRGPALAVALRAIMTLGKTWRAEREAWSRAGDMALWPFVSSAQLTHVASHHPFVRHPDPAA